MTEAAVKVTCTACAARKHPCPVCTVAATWERRAGSSVSRRCAQVMWASDTIVAWRYRGHRVTSPSKILRWPPARFYAGFRVVVLPPATKSKPPTGTIPLSKLKNALALDKPAPNSATAPWTKVGERGNTSLFLQEESPKPARKRKLKA